MDQSFSFQSAIPLSQRTSNERARVTSWAAPKNPPLGQWRRVEPARQVLMKQELQRILDVPSLSKGTFEMATRSIA